MQVIVAEQDAIRRFSGPHVSSELRGITQRCHTAWCTNPQFPLLNKISVCFGMGSRMQRTGLIQYCTGVSDDLCSADRVVSTPFLCPICFVNRVRSIQRIVQAAPSGIGCVQGKAGVLNRDHQLRPGLQTDFLVYVIGFNDKVSGRLSQVSDTG